MCFGRVGSGGLGICDKFKRKETVFVEELGSIECESTKNYKYLIKYTKTREKNEEW